jgi:hypothetical protein
MRLRTDNTVTAACSGSERAGGHARRQRSAALGTAVRTTHALAPMLGHPDGHHRQLLDLAARWLSDRDAVGL